MFIILYYDMGENRVAKMLKTCRKYLLWVQNSVFEGEISEANYQRLLFDIEKIVDKSSSDSIVIYQFRSMLYSKRDVIGNDKKIDINFI